MAEDYQVVSGDCMSSIAYTHGFFWETLWNLPENAGLKNQRKNPNVLMDGDTVHIPDLTVRQEARPTDAKHKFMLKGVPEKLYIRLLDYDKQPRPNVDYVITIDGDSHRGTTDGDGGITESIPPDAKTGKITYSAPEYKDHTGKPVFGTPRNQVMMLQLGGLNPITETSGVKARLANLGFYHGQVNENMNEAAKAAIRIFQTSQKIPVTGEADDATRQNLLNLHGH